MVYLLKYSQFKFEGLGLDISNPRPSDSNWLYFNIKGGTHPTLLSIYAVPLFFIYSCKYNAKWSMYKIASFRSPKKIVRRDILRWLQPTKPKSDNIYQFIFCCSVPVCFLHNVTRLINGVSSLFVWCTKKDLPYYSCTVSRQSTCLLSMYGDCLCSRIFGITFG